MTETPSYNPRIHWFALVTCVATLGLIGVGGVVTSTGVGMAVPDWPNTYGYNMFFFPFSQAMTHGCELATPTHVAAV